MQPVSGDQYLRISGTAAGTTVVQPHTCLFTRVVFPSNQTGTVTFYDHVSGTTAASKLGSYANTTGTIPTSVEFGIQMKNGLVAETGGTTDFLVVFN